MRRLLLAVGVLAGGLAFIGSAPSADRTTVAAGAHVDLTGTWQVAVNSRVIGTVTFGPSSQGAYASFLDSAPKGKPYDDSNGHQSSFGEYQKAYGGCQVPPYTNFPVSRWYSFTYDFYDGGGSGIGCQDTVVGRIAFIGTFLHGSAGGDFHIAYIAPPSVRSDETDNLLSGSIGYSAPHFPGHEAGRRFTAIRQTCELAKPTIVANADSGSPSSSIVGTSGNDVIIGTYAADRIDGGGGADTICGGGGDDTISVPPAGSLVANGGAGNDTITGGAGQDSLAGNEGNDTLKGEGGNDALHGQDGIDVLIGGAGDDALQGGKDHDLLDGGAGNDELTGDSVSDDAGAADLLKGGSGNDRLFGGLGDDILQGGSGNNLLYGEGGDDVLTGGAGNEKLYGGSGEDTLFGKGGEDTLFGGTEDDHLLGGAGDDLLFGQPGVDRDEGGPGDDGCKGEIFFSCEVKHRPG